MRRLSIAARTPIAIGALLLLALALILMPAPRPAWAGVDDFAFDSFAADYTLSRAADGTSRLKTVETLTPVFPDFDQNRGIIRRIPVEYKGVNTHVRVASVTDQNGAPVPYQIDSSGGDVKISVGNDTYLRGRHTFIITYTQRNVISTDAKTGNQEFYWDVNGTQWAQRFGSVAATVRMGSELTARRQPQTLCVAGAGGSTTPCRTQPATGDDTRFAASTTDLGPEQTMTIGVSFRTGTFTVPIAPASQPWAIGMGAAGILLAIAGFITALIARLRHWRDAPGRGIVVAQYEPPAGLSVFEAGDLMGAAHSARALTAFILDLAVRGNAHLIQGRQRLLGTDYDLQLLRPDGLDDLETKVVGNIFSPQTPAPGVTTSLTDGPKHRGDAIGTTLSELPARMRRQGLRARPTRPLPGWARVAALGAPGAAIALSAVLGMAGASGPLSWTALLCGVGALVVDLFVLFARPSQLTAAGAEAREHLQGLRLFIDVAEERRLQVLQSAAGAQRRTMPTGAELVHLYERLLPYAALFGQEKSWSRALGALYERTGTQPSWASGPDPFTTGVFVGAIHGLSSSLTSGSGAVASSSSSSSGFSGGGGFAGGGGGGGGGGGR
ncbi:MAG: DUF2207 domain-containing protein [Pseudoclavibacter sp.]